MRVFLLVFLLATPAFAEFTAAEKANLHALTLAINLVHSGMQAQAQGGGGPANQSYQRARQAVDDCNRAYAYLFGINSLQGEPARSQLEAAPRSSWLGSAWYHLDRCISDTDLAAQWTSIPAAAVKYGQARDQLIAFPRGGGASPSLYLSPYPAEPVIGPHGTYRWTQEYLWFGMKYTHDVIWDRASVYCVDASNYIRITSAGLADIRFTSSETADGFSTIGVDPVTNVLWLFKFINRDTGEKLHACQANEAPHPKITDAWRNLDTAKHNMLCIESIVACHRVPH